MDIYDMQYFLAVTREGNISLAAESLHISQPSLSKQMKDLEEELGVTLFIRGSRKITLTEEGMILRKRAEEMVHLLNQTQEEIANVKNDISGDIHIGAGETRAFHYISRIAADLMKQHPGIHLHVRSGDSQDLTDSLENGLIDIALLFTDVDRSRYHAINIPIPDHFGILMRKDSPLAKNEIVTDQDLVNQPLIISRASDPASIGDAKNGLQPRIVATYNLINNAAMMVEDGIGYALCLEGLGGVSEESSLTFRPIRPVNTAQAILVWKKYTVFPPAVKLMIDHLQKDAENQSEGDFIKN